MDALTPPNMLANISPAQQIAAMPPDAKPVTHDVTIVTTRKLAQARVMGVPPEEFGIERAARNIKDANYAFHEVVTKTRSQLIAEGFDEEQINALTDYTGTNNEIEAVSRDSVREHYGTNSPNPAASPVKITEHYIRMDYKGDGKPCLYQVMTGGDQGEILNRDDKPCIEAVDVMPFATWTPVPQTHRFFGRSMADLTMDIQRVKTALVRGMLDNLYLHNNPRVEVAEANAGPNTLDDLLVSRPGGVVRTKVPGGLNWQVVPDITASIYPALQYMDATRELRTGLSNQSQGIDANALQNQSATAVAQVFSASQMRLKLVARLLAEGVKDICSLLHGVIRRHGQEKQTVRLRNNWVDVDPRQWKTRNDMTIHVGLGTGGKAQQFAQVMALGNFQKELLLGGKVNLVDDQALFNTGTELVKIMGFKNVDKFINDPSAKDPQTGQPLHPPVPPPEDPKVTALKLKAQTDQMAAQQKAEIEKLQAQADIATQDRKTQAEIALADRKANLEAELKMLEFQMKKEEHGQKMDLSREQHQQSREEHQLTIQQGQQTHEQTIQKAQLDIHGKQQDHRAKHAQDYPEHATADQVNQTSEGIKGLQQALADHAKAIDEANNAPIEIVRGKDGKATGIKKGKRTLTIDRGPDGRAKGLQ